MADTPTYDRYTLRLNFHHRLIGGIPRNPALIEAWQAANWPSNPDKKLQEGDPQTPGQAATATAEALGTQVLTEEALDEVASKMWTGFAEQDGLLVIEARQVKAALKESANILRPILKVRNKVIPLKARLAERVFVQPHFIPLGRTEPDGTEERAIHVMTAQGPRTALKRFDYCERPTLECTLTVLDDGIFTEERLRAILDHAALNGMGADRSQGNGEFTYELTKTE